MTDYTFSVWENNAWSVIPHGIFPLKTANLLDEQLDEVELQFKSINRATFRPNTLCKLLITVTYGSETDTKEEYFVVANDKATEYPIGSGRFNHELYLIESTKILEGYICDTLTFTNPLGNVYTDDSENA